MPDIPDKEHKQAASVEAPSPGHRKPAFLSVDCDSQIDYFRIYGVSPRSDFQDRVYRAGIPRLLDAFASVGAKATFFLVGREALKPHNREVLRRIVDEGHEVGNHSLTHPSNFTRYGLVSKAYELDGAHKAISDVTGQEPVGFRAPAYSIDRETLDLLEERGYLYDSSVFPSALLALLQGIIRSKSRNRSNHLVAGSVCWHLAPKRPYRPDVKSVWRQGQRHIWEVPVTVVPPLHLPFDGTFLLWAGMGYFRAAFYMVSRRAPSLVFQYHPMELMTVGKDGIDERMGRHPGLAMPVEKKEQFIRECLRRMSALYEFLPGQEFLRRAGCLEQVG